MYDGELVIFDVGTELDHYVSDVGRTFPVSGEFTKEQKRILQTEEVVVVTEEGVDVLTKMLPRFPEALEEMVGAR